MKTKIIFLLVIIFTTQIRFSFSQKLSDKAEISIITCGAGNELYSTFGHSAIRVCDIDRNIDFVFNYGTFDFETPGFYSKFAKGQLDYMLSVAHYKYFLLSYVNENRAVKEQILNLTHQEKEDMYKFLKNNALPENKFYRYDFFYDNCATRVKDVVKDVLGEKLILGSSEIDTLTTFRDIINKYLAGNNWERSGIYLSLGIPADNVVTHEQATFIPDYLEIVLRNSRILSNGQLIPLVKSENILYKQNEQETRKGFADIVTPLFVFWLLLGAVLILSFIEFKFSRYFKTFDNILFFVIGFIGFAILFLWFGTDHRPVVGNLNILWANPLFIFSVFFYHKEKFKHSFRYFFLLFAIIALSALIPYGFFPQRIDPAFIPFIITISLRSFLVFFRK